MVSVPNTAGVYIREGWLLDGISNPTPDMRYPITVSPNVLIIEDRIEFYTI